MSSTPKNPEADEDAVEGVTDADTVEAPSEDETPEEEVSVEKGTSAAAEAFFGTPPAEAAAPEGLEEQVERFARRSPTWRSPTLLILVIGVSGWLLWSMRADLAYFLSDPSPTDLGNLEEYDLSSAAHNSYVTIEGLPHHLQAQYKQLGARYKVYPLIGTRVFIRERLSSEDAISDEYPIFAGSGRLMDIREERTYANVRAFYQEKGRFDFSRRPAWILLVGEAPGRAYWVPVVYLVLGAILLLNLFLLVKRLVGRRRR